MLKIYTDTNFLKKHPKGEKFPLVYALLFDERNEFTEVKKYYELTENIDEAEIAMLPCSWNYYLNKGLQQEAESFIK